MAFLWCERFKGEGTGFAGPGLEVADLGVWGVGLEGCPHAVAANAGGAGKALDATLGTG